MDAGLNPIMVKPTCRAAFGAVCLVLLCVDLWGTFFRVDLRSEFSKPLISYEKALNHIDRAWTSFGPSKAFVEKAVRIYAKAIEYKWPAGLARVPFTDNWILALAAYLDPVIELVGLKKDAQLFSQFESYRYERALGRGFGICSENALGFADLLNRRYDIDIHTVGLRGHVVTQANLADGNIILDPSLGVAIPMGLIEAENKLDVLRAIYEKAGNPDVSKAYNIEGNFISPSPGARGYSEIQYGKQEAIRYFERITDVLKWIIPLFALVSLIALGRKSKAKAMDLICDSKS